MDVQPRFKVARKRKPKGTVPTKVKRWVKARDGQHCVARIAEICTGSPDHVHHICRKAQGGDNEMGNLITVCLPCHTYIHANISWSRVHGYIRSNVKGSA